MGRPIEQKGSSPRAGRRSRPGGRIALFAVLLLAAIGGALPAGATAEQASGPGSPAAGGVDAGGLHSCAVLVAGNVRCWGYGANGQLGYANTDTIGDDETPASVGPVSLGAGHTARAIAAGDYHTCAILDDGSVRCWGYGADGRLGYANTNDVSDPSSVGPVDLGGHRAQAVTAGSAHTCAILDDGSVRCWGYGGGGLPRDGRLGYGNTDNVGDNETPGSLGPVKLGGRAVAISAGGTHTCAILDDGNVRCWGRNDSGQLGYGNRTWIGDTPTTTPDTAGPVNLGTGHTAKAISAGGAHTCAVLDDGNVRCWGDGSAGQLGYANTNNVGDAPATTPDTAGPVDLGPRRTAVAISAGDAHTCAILDDGNVRCWGSAANGRLGYPTLDRFGNQDNVGDNETPGSVGPVDLGAGRTATAISAGGQHTCARLDDGHVRCWGKGADGRLGYCNTDSIGDNESPGSVGPVNLQPGDGGAGCASIPASPGGGPGVAPVAAPGPPGGGHPAVPPRRGRRPVDPYVSQALRAQALSKCLKKAARGTTRHRTRAQKSCLKRYGRTPGRVTRVRARAVSPTAVVLSFTAPGSDGPTSPPARAYLIKQSSRPIRGSRAFRRAETLCKGSCRFKVASVGTRVILTITHLRPHSTYYYAIVARDNVSGRLGPRSPTAAIRTR